MKKISVNIGKNTYIYGDKYKIKKGGQISDEKAQKDRLVDIYSELQVFVDTGIVDPNKNEKLQNLLKEYTEITGKDYFAYRTQVINDIQELEKAGLTGADQNKNRALTLLLAQFREITGKNYYSEEENRLEEIKRKLDTFVDAGYTSPRIPGTNNTGFELPEGYKFEDFQTLLDEYTSISKESYFARSHMSLKQIKHELRRWERASSSIGALMKFKDFQKLLQMYTSRTGTDYFSDENIKERSSDIMKVKL